MKKPFALICLILCSLNIAFAKYKEPHYTILPQEWKGAKVYADFMLTSDLIDDINRTTAVIGLTASAGYQMSHFFFLGGKTGAIIVPQDFCSVPLALNMRWTFGRNNILIIDKSTGIAFARGEIHLYKDWSLGGRIPIGGDERMLCVSIGYAMFPQQISLIDCSDGNEFNTELSWIAPQLKISYQILRRR